MHVSFSSDVMTAPLRLAERVLFPFVPVQNHDFGKQNFHSSEHCSVLKELLFEHL